MQLTKSFFWSLIFLLKKMRDRKKQWWRLFYNLLCSSLTLSLFQSWFYLMDLTPHFSTLFYISKKLENVFLSCFKILTSFRERTLYKCEIECYSYLFLSQSYSKNIIMWLRLCKYSLDIFPMCDHAWKFNYVFQLLVCI